MVSEDNFCYPGIFGYSQEDGLLVFPEYQYPECSAKMVEPVPEISINLEENKFTLDCPDNEAYYVIDASPNLNYLYFFEDVVPYFNL